MEYKKAKILDILLKLTIIVGFVSFFISVSMNKSWVWAICISLLFILSPILGIVIIIRNKQRKKIKAAFLISINLLIIWLLGFRVAPFIYAPPAICQDDLAVYQQCVDTFTTVEIDRLDYWGSLNSPKSFLVRFENSTDELNQLYSENEIVKIRETYKNIRKLGILKIEKEDNCLLFMKRQSMREFNTTDVVYSVDSGNPNLLENEIIERYKPLIHIGGNWYSSDRELPTRGSIPLFLPEKSICDRSNEPLKNTNF